MVLVRHGESVANAQGIYQGHNDSHLSKLGRTQAKILAERLKTKRYKFDRIYSSDLSRASETALIIVTHLKTRFLPVIYTPLLREMDLGAFAGKKIDLLSPDEHAYLETIWKERTKRFPGGESINLLVERLDEFMDMVEKLPTSVTSILVVTHGGPIYHILSSILGLLKGLSFDWFGNCQVNEIERVNTVSTPRKWKLLTINDKLKSIYTQGSSIRQIGKS